MSAGYKGNCTVARVGAAAKESVLVAVSDMNIHCLHRLHTADSVQNVGATQEVDERAAVDQKMRLIHFVDDAEDCAAVGDVHLCLYSTGAWGFLFEILPDAGAVFVAVVTHELALDLGTCLLQSS